MRSATLRDRHLSKVNPLYGRSLSKMDVPQTGRHLSKADIVLSTTDRHLTTVLAKGIAALHACFMRVTMPYCTQFPRKIHANYMRKTRE